MVSAFLNCMYIVYTEKEIFFFFEGRQLRALKALIHWHIDKIDWWSSVNDFMDLFEDSLGK